MQAPPLREVRGVIDAVELLPFRRALEAGVDAVMLGHIAVPALDATGAPATLSPAVGEQLLRGEEHSVDWLESQLDQAGSQYLQIAFV